jgi:hypothetical protein
MDTITLATHAVYPWYTAYTGSSLAQASSQATTRSTVVTTSRRPE